MSSINNIVQTSLLIILFFFLFNESQGIRLRNGMMQPVELLEKVLEKEIPLVAEGFSKSTLPKNDHSNSGRSSRKLVMETSPSSLRNEEANKKEKPMLKAKDLDNNNSNNNKNNNSEMGSVSENVEKHYPDLIDIAEMDYSPAKRKPPIHN